MPHSDFVHLHVHSQYSLLDGACLIPDLVKRAAEFKMPALAVTDHGNMFGAIEFYEAAMKGGVKPIIGCECYIAPESRFDKSLHGVDEASFHIILLAKDEEGYKNLIKLVSAGYLEGFYYKPRIDDEILAQHSKGLIGLSSCLHGEIPHLLGTEQSDAAKALSGKYKDIFGKDNFYLELMDHSIPEQKKMNIALLELAKVIGAGVVATNDVHYLKKEYAKAHEALLCIQTQTNFDDPKRMRFKTDEFYLKSPGEMKELFKDTPEAIKNTVVIAERCNLELDFKKTHMPHFRPPDGKSREEYLKELVAVGLKDRYPNADQVVHKRIEHELSVIHQSGYVSYFLITWDFVRHAKESGISVGPGRGSASGSVVSYCLGITNIDPLKYDLLFERFLNPDRVSMPDIDIDFCYERRDEVIQYVRDKYGKDNVAQIITFGTMLAKAAIRDVGRALNMLYGDVDKIAKLVPNDLDITIDKALQQEPELKRLYKTDPKIAQLIDISKVLEGVTRHASTHAAGVVISEKPLINYIPLYKTSDDQISTGYPMGSLEKVGLLKMDFLGLRTLTVIEEALKIIKRTKGVDLDIKTISLEDEKTYGLLSAAETIGVFQLESQGMRDILRKLEPTRFEEIIAILALFRPGPIGSGMVEDFIKRKHGTVAIKYDHPLLEPILKDTYGVILYQEQIMRIASTVAGFSLSHADSLRRAISKKTPEVIEDARVHFIAGCSKNGIAKLISEKIFNQIEYFAGYGFNKSHSAAYALISYRTAHLKANYPVEFMTALLTSERDNTDKIANYIDEAERMGIKVLPPDVNESFAKFTVVEKSIRFGMAAVKNVGQGSVDSIIEARNSHGKFKSVHDFCEHVDLRLVNRKVIESLIKCGACDGFKLYRSQLIAMVDNALEVAQAMQKDRQGGQMSFFDTFEDDAAFKKTFADIPNIKEWPEHQLLIFEKEMLGFYITGHPLMQHERLIRNYSTSTTMGLIDLKDGDEVALGGIIAKVKNTVTKKTGEKMAIMTLEDLDGSVEVLVFPKSYAPAQGNIKVDAMVFVKGRINLREEQPKIIANEIVPLLEAPQKFTKGMQIRLNTISIEENSLKELKGILAKYPGKLPVELLLSLPNGRRVKLSVEKNLCVGLNDALPAEIEERFGKGALKFVTGNGGAGKG